MKKSTIIFLALLFVAFLVVYPLTLFHFSATLSQNPIILVTGDFSSQGFGKDVMKGVTHAIKESTSNTEIDIEKIEINEYTEAELKSGLEFSQNLESKNFERKMIKLISDKNVIGIIAANSSETINPVLTIGKTFNIPVLINVSTNDNILNEENSKILRLLPNDKNQSQVLASKIEELSRDTTEHKIGILYSPTVYGRDLRNTLRNHIESPEQLIPFAIGTTTDLTGTLKYGNEMNVDFWIVITYKNEAREVYAKMSGLKLDRNVLFTDGGYGDWFKEITSNKVYLCMPKMENKANELFGFSALGFDSYKALTQAYKLFIEENYKTKADFFQNLINVLESESNNNGYFNFKYSFNAVGQNELAQFTIYKIKDGNYQNN